MLNAKAEYTPFITQQMAYVFAMNENNVTKEEIREILKAQALDYRGAVDQILANKSEYINNVELYETEIYTLQKIIKVNRRAGYKYAVLRDEIQIKSYTLLANQNRMLKNILLALAYTQSDEFEKELNKFTAQNQLQNQTILGSDYKDILALERDSKTVNNVKKNILEFYALVEINQDMINNLYIHQNKMYRLNKYSKYNLIGTVLYINSFSVVKEIDAFLEYYDLTVIKLIVITFLILIIYFFRKVAYVSLENYIIGIDSLRKYSKDILDVIRKPLEFLIVIININMIVYVYHDFSNTILVAKVFNMLYGFFLTLIIYKILNAIAGIKIHEIDTHEKQIKNEIINVGIKVINFIIMILGLLVVLHFAGANLTAVLSGLGIGGFAVALAAKDSLANFFGTLSILFSDVFSQGDWIVIDGKEGVVVEIGLRVTTLRTFDNALIAIPNAILANQDVKNWNKRTLGRRIKMSLGVKYDSSSSDIKNAVKDIREMLDTHKKIATEKTKYQYKSSKSAKLVSVDDSQGVKKTLLVYLDTFSDSSINILVYCFTKSTDWADWLETKEDVMHKIMEIFEKNNLEFAFPSLSLYHESSSPKEIS